MSEQYIENFWNKGEDQLKHYTTLFNNDMGSKGFKVEYKMPIEVCYTLIMNYLKILNTEGMYFFYLCMYLKKLFSVSGNFFM